MNERALRWRCRRGLLELDLALAQFVATRYGALSAADRTLFQELLQESDADLWDWIQGSEPPARFAPILESFRLGPCSSTP